MSTREARELTIESLAEQLGCSFEGNGDVCVNGVAPLAKAGPHDLSFVRSPRWAAGLRASRAAAVIAAPGVDTGTIPRIRSDRPALHFGRAVSLILPRILPRSGIHPTAEVDPSAKVDPAASVGAFCSIGAGCMVGPRTVLHPRVTLYDDVEVGSDTLIHAGIVVREGVSIGSRVVLEPGVVLGGDGFGYEFDEHGQWEHAPQVGRVVIEDDVEIGANTTIDRATLGETRIGRGTKIDNQVMIGHNCNVGEQVILTGQAGLAGSSTIERRAIIMGQVAIGGHLTIGEGAFLGGRAGVAEDVRPGVEIWGIPGMEGRAWFRSMAWVARLPELVKRLRIVEKRLGLRGPDGGETPRASSEVEELQ